ncbi:DUF6456 domain-containing protein [Thalassococcus profundi]|uniref:DUF6456 domain-containing protein n=1 Tax=Thalassococcus profundi TaxID=2282382 RepID=UPI001F4392DE|nr:DUF6456 domain-containing protein [Thalassococcus profundi]
MDGHCDFGRLQSLPDWVPQNARHYLAHIEAGLPIRALARAAGCHASTVLRQVRRIEAQRDDPLIDAALRRLGTYQRRSPSFGPEKDHATMTAIARIEETEIDENRLSREARRILRRLSESGAVLAVAAEMDKAVVVRDTADGGTARTAVVDSAVAQAMALKDWIACDAPGRISRYRITALGRTALSRLLAEQESRLRGFAEAQTAFSSGRALEAALDDTEDSPQRRRSGYALSDSPLTALARRRDKTGAPFLSDALVSAGERLREDFELAQVGATLPPDWDLSQPVGPDDPRAPLRGVEGARVRLARVLRDLGPGLSEIALRCCCYLEGLETAEKRMGWSARSGKIVLRIALQRLKRHYDETTGPGGGLIG